jgi:16S rRNA (cytosine967-C5)-methyltransferase
VDAPCSGLGTLRRSPDLKLRHVHEDVTAFAALQRSILERFSGRVKPGGRLAYATCSILREENEDVALDFAAAHPEFKTCPSEWARAHLPPGCVQDGFVHLDPALTRTDGFFLALWKRDA